LNFERHYSKPNYRVDQQVKWKLFNVVDPKTEEERHIWAPETWSQNAATILATKYLRRAGVPTKTKLRIEAHIGHHRAPLPEWLWPRVPAADAEFGGETSAHQAFHRLAGHWTYWAWREGLMRDSEQAHILYDEAYLMLAWRVAAPNSPQWFNTGLWWAYGIEGAAQGQWVADNGVPRQTENAYERPQVHACYIQPVDDDLVNEGGMMDLWTREARLFKGGSGSGSNMSSIRGRGEPLSGGGSSSGLMSFLEVGDRSAGSIQSGGTTRRAALMRVLDLDHPEIEDFIWWKEREEAKAAALSVGSARLHDKLWAIAEAQKNGATRSVIQAYVDEARLAGVPEAMINRALQSIVPDELPVGFESEALRTVSGQNSNNSVRVTNDFLRRVDNDDAWHLTRRTDGRDYQVMSARDLWDQVCRATWAAGDPGVQLEDTINEWHTCPEGGRIRASNPCSEYLFLDNTACNLASLRLTAFLQLDGGIDLDAFEHAVRIWTVILDLSVSMAGYPSREIAERSIAYRTLGLGHADLGGLLMRLGLPYDSEEGRSLAASLTALMTGVAYRTSAQMAGAFPEYFRNAENMRRVMRNHARAAGLETELIEGAESPEYEGLSVLPCPLHHDDVDGDIYARIQHAWIDVCGASSFRNAQVTLLAPTGTIGLLMDCDTLGIEPDFSLVKHKNLAGGGSMRIINEAVPAALMRLGYNEGDVLAIEAHLHETGELPTDGIVSVRREHLSVFACSMPSGGVPAISPEAHVKMVGVVQPFLSGGVSKTINLPRDATVETVRAVYRYAHRLGVKAVAPYRDGSKLTQPLAATAPKSPFDKVVQDGLCTEKEAQELDKWIESLDDLPRGVRELPPWERDGKIQKAKIGDQSIWVTVGHYPDGRPCEVFLNLAKEGSTLRGMADLLCMAISLGLQFGVPMREYVERFTHTKFEPAGLVEGHPEIAITSSIGDLLGRHLGIRYCDAGELGDRRARIPEPTPEQTEYFKDLAERHVPYDPGARLQFSPSGEVCPQCHNATLVPNGSCKFCTTCNESIGGCGP